MVRNSSIGLYLFHKNNTSTSPVLKDLLHLSRSITPSKTAGFSFVHSDCALIPTLTLWENLKLSVPYKNWDDFILDLSPEIRALAKLIKNPSKLPSQTENWECFIVSLLCGIYSPSPSLLIDMQEQMHSPFSMKAIKSTLIQISQTKMVYLASPAPSVWLDCAHHLVRREGYQFVFEEMDHEELKKHWVA